MNILCLGGLTTGVAVAWNCVKSFLAAKFSGAERHRRRLAKVSAIRTIRLFSIAFQLFVSQTNSPWNIKQLASWNN